MSHIRTTSKKKYVPYPRFPDFSIIRTTSQKKYVPFPKYFSYGLQRKKKMSLFLPQTSYNGAYQIHVPMGQGVSQSCFPIQNLLYFQKIIIKFHKSHGILAQIANLLKKRLCSIQQFQRHFYSQTSYNGAYQIHVPMGQGMS